MCINIGDTKSGLRSGEFYTELFVIYTLWKHHNATYEGKSICHLDTSDTCHIDIFDRCHIIHWREYEVTEANMDLQEGRKGIDRQREADGYVSTSLRSYL